MVALRVEVLTIGTRTFNSTKSGYPMMPTVYSGVDITWGAGSCIEHPDPSRAQLSLWIPKTHEDWIPALGDEVVITGGQVTEGVSALNLFAGKVESVKLQDDHGVLPAALIPNSVNMTNLTGWTFSWAYDNFTPTNMNASVTITDGKDFTVPFLGTAGVAHFFTVKVPRTPVAGGNRYTLTWESNNASHSVIAEYFNAAGSLISSTQTYGHNGRFNFTAPAGAVNVDLKLGSIMNVNYKPVFTIGTFILGSEATPGYRVNIVAADALAEASRLRVSSPPWLNESLLNRQVKIAELATSAGVTFSAGLTEDQGYYEALNTDVRPRDVDSYPALELFQRTTMAAGHTVVSVGNVVQPSNILKLPNVLGVSMTGVTTTYEWVGTAGKSKSVMKVNGIITRTNETSNPTARDWSTGYSVLAGTGGTASLGVMGSDGRNGTENIRAYWSVAPTAGLQGIFYKDPAVAGATGSKVSVGMWVRVGLGRGLKLVATLFNGATPVGTATSSTVTLTGNSWTYMKLDNVTATGAYTSVEVSVQPVTNMTTGSTIYVDGVLIEKVAAGGTYFDGDTLDIAANVVPVENSGITYFDSSALVDDTFELDTSKVVNEIKIELTKFVGSVGPPGWEQLDETNQAFDQVFTDQAGSRKTTPQTRSIETDWCVRDAYMDDVLPTSVMVTKGKLLLAGQSKPQWRLSSALAPVLSEVPEQDALNILLDEATRFGGLIRIDNGPALIPKYVRVRGGRIVLGDNAHLEFDVEPVEYSAPVPLSRETLSADNVASSYRIGNAHTLTSNDLRLVGAR